MKDYHFEKDESRFDETIRLDKINEKVKELKHSDVEDELGDANAFLDAFESEKFDTPEDTSSDIPSRPAGRAAQEDADEEEPSDGLSKRSIGLLAFAGVIACILGFSLVRCGIRPAPVPVDAQAYPMLVEGIVDGDEVVVYDIANDARKTLLFTEETEIIDAAGRELAFGSTAVGDLLMAELAQDGKTVLSADYSNPALEHTEVTGLTPDSSARTLTGEDRSFSYGKQAIFLYDGQSISPADIAPADRLLLRGYADTVWSVQVLEYHGYLIVENGDNIKNGSIQIDEGEAVPLEDVGRIPIGVGSHTITVTGENIEQRKDAISINAGEELRYDLSKAQEKMGVIIIEANVSDYRLYINGTLSESPAVLPVGEYNLVILKNGYLEWNEHINLEGDSITVVAELEKEFQYGTLTVTANCDGAAVYINGEASGIAPMQVNLPYGSYTVRVEKEGYQPFEQTIQMNDSKASLYAELT